MTEELIVSYKDMTFCYSDCVNTKCYRNFSPEHRANAIKWWGDDTFPLAMSESFRVGCDDYKQPQEGETEDAA